MKSALILLLLCILVTLSAEAQRWELQPVATLGIGNAFTNPITPKDGKPIANYGFAVNLVGKYGRWRVTTGISYLTTGYGIGGEFIIVDSFGQPMGTATGHYALRYTHVGLPILLGYKMPVVKRVSFIPSIGIMPSYNASARERSVVGPNTVGPVAMPKDKFDKYYNRFSLLAIADARFQYYISKKISLVGGAAFYAMLNSIGKTSAYMKEYDFDILFEAGMGFGL